MNQNKER
jgi:hypothetical protein